MSAPPARAPARLPLVEGLRAFAALAVVVVHTSISSKLLDTGAVLRGLAAHLDLGVAVFFALSGFLLHRPFLAARELEARRVGVGRYAVRRVLRIFPAYWLALLVLGVALGLHGVLDRAWWVRWLLLQDYGVGPTSPGCGTDPPLCGIAPSWTLSVEVLFYAWLPVHALLLGGLVRLAPRRWHLVELGVLAALAAVSFLIQGLVVGFEPWTSFSPLGRAWWFAAGMALAVVAVRIEQVGEVPRGLRTLARRPGLA